MTPRDFAILNKALCYAVAAFTVFCTAVFAWLGSSVAFPAGIAAAVACSVIAEFLIFIPQPDSEGKDDD